jgi:membrane protein YdbS with pleckstrin-like domain
MNNKTANTLVFMLVATIFNLLITALCVVILFFIYVNVLYTRYPESIQWALMVIIAAAILAAFFIYRAVMYKIVLKKVDIEKHFSPLFPARKKKF